MLYLIPISLYLGWIIVATITNFSYWLVASVGIETSIQTVLTYALLGLTTLVGLGIIFYLKDWAIVLVFVWAMYGIFTKNLPDHRLIALVTIVLAVILLIGIIASFVINRGTTKKIHIIFKNSQKKARTFFRPSLFSYSFISFYGIISLLNNQLHLEMF